MLVLAQLVQGILQNVWKRRLALIILSCFIISFSVLECPFSVLERPFSVLERAFLLCPVLSCGTGRDSCQNLVPSRGIWQALPDRPVLWQDFELVPLSLCPGTMKELLSLCPENLHCPVPLETLVWCLEIMQYSHGGQFRDKPNSHLYEMCFRDAIHWIQVLELGAGLDRLIFPAPLGTIMIKIWDALYGNVIGIHIYPVWIAF